MPSVFDVINFKTQDITMYLQRIDRVRKDDALSTKVYDQTIDYIRKSYLYGVIQSVQNDNNFYTHIPPELKNKLIFLLLMSYYQKFFFFFNDVYEQNFADLVFVRKVLSRLDCIIFINESKIVEPGK